MPSYSKNEVLLVRYPFSDLSVTKVRPAVVVHAPHVSQDNLMVPLTSQTAALLAGEFILTDWISAGLHVPTPSNEGFIPSIRVWFSNGWGSYLLPTRNKSMILSARGWDCDEHD